MKEEWKHFLKPWEFRNSKIVNEELVSKGE
jgi:hypothetical protein